MHLIGEQVELLPELRIKETVVLAGPSQPLVCSKVPLRSRGALSLTIPNNDSLIAAARVDSNAKVAAVPGLSGLSTMLTSKVL
jgi:hypothetical protein